MTETTAKKDIQKLQRAIVDGLEDVKAQDIVVFNTEHLSPLFERVMIASGTSNRQTKALASSVRDQVRDAGFPKPRLEGEENGEWIIIDCGQAIVHVMQPAIRQYYHLEEIWGDKPVRLKFGAPQPAKPKSEPKTAPANGAARKSTRKPSGAKAAPVARSAPRKTATGVAAKKTAVKAPAKSAPAKTASAKTVAAKKPRSRQAAKA